MVHHQQLERFGIREVVVGGDLVQDPTLCEREPVVGVLEHKRELVGLNIRELLLDDQTRLQLLDSVVSAHLLEAERVAASTATVAATVPPPVYTRPRRRCTFVYLPWGRSYLLGYGMTLLTSKPADTNGGVPFWPKIATDSDDRKDRET